MKPATFLLFTIVIILSGGCKKRDGNDCVEVNRGKISFSERGKLIIPYALYDSLVFFNKKMHSFITYSCMAQASAYEIVSENHSNSQGNIECLGNYFEKEYSITRFNNATGKFIILWETTPDPFDSLYKENGLQIGLCFSNDSIFPFEGFYAFKKDTIFNYPNCPFAKVETYFDTLTIENKLYQQVYLLKGGSGPNNTETIVEIYYSISEGIIQFVTNRNNVWSLQKKFIIH